MTAIPKGATIERRFTGAYEGDVIQVTLYKGQASDGYKSDFTRRPARWIVWTRHDSSGKRTLRHATRFGGKRFVHGPVEFEFSVEELRAGGVVPIQS